MEMLQEKAKSIPVIHEADLCVLGGSCTGVFAAVRAARLGLKVALVEQQNCFGGVATISMVNAWHCLLDTVYKQQIIAGLTEEVLNRLQLRGAVQVREPNPLINYTFNSEELKIELDELVRESGIKPYLHTFFVAPFVADDGELIGAVVENKSGRGVIKAKAFVDATGDADLASRLGLEVYRANHLQPSTTCAKFSGWDSMKASEFDFGKAYLKYKDEFGLPDGFAWGCKVPGDGDIYMLAGTRVHAFVADGDSLTEAEMEGRRQVRALMDMVRKYGDGASLGLHALPSRIGIRESRHVVCRHQLNGDEVLYGTRFADAIANGTYPSDLHHQDKEGITFRYLDGTSRYSRPGHPVEVGRWREPIENEPKFYQIPYRSMVPKGPIFPNVIVAGRMIDADMLAHAAIRVMVNMNQTGEAAGVAAYLALSESVGFADVDPARLRKTLVDGGSVMV